LTFIDEYEVQPGNSEFINPSNVEFIDAVNVLLFFVKIVAGIKNSELLFDDNSTLSPTLIY